MADADPETARLLSNIHRTLELIALLLAVLVATQGSIATIIGGSAVLLIVGEWLIRGWIVRDT